MKSSDVSTEKNQTYQTIQRNIPEHRPAMVLR